PSRRSFSREASSSSRISTPPAKPSPSKTSGIAAGTSWSPLSFAPPSTSPCTRYGRSAGVLAVFLVSGLMHEVMFWYVTLAPPTGEVTAFFVLHGACVVAEGASRRAGWRRPPAVFAMPLTLSFVGATGFSLFYPPILRSHAEELVLAECAAAMDSLEADGRAVLAQVT
ncbi:MBOAT, membrane-bound O-acyltransferase family, partial [Musa troglodytarum]